MIKVISKSPISIKIGNTTVPAFSSVLLDYFPATSETSRLINKGLLSVVYIPNEPTVSSAATDVINVHSDNVCENTIEELSTTNVVEDVNVDVKVTRKRKSKTSTENVENTNLTKGDMNNASDND